MNPVHILFQHPPTYASVSQVVCSLPVSQPKFCISFLPFSCMLHAPHVSLVTLVIFGEDYKKLISSLCSCNVPNRRFKYSPQHSVRKRLICVQHLECMTRFYTHKTTSEIGYSFENFNCYVFRREDKRPKSWACSQSWIQPTLLSLSRSDSFWAAVFWSVIGRFSWNSVWMWCHYRHQHLSTFKLL
jgi:hypothetical protein